MKLRQEVLDKLDNIRGYALIMLTIGCSHTSAITYVRTNNDNLTKAAMLKAIGEEFGLTESEILESEVPEGATK